MAEIEVVIPPATARLLDARRYAKALTLALDVVAEEVKTEAMRYPGSAHRPVKWASAKSRRYYFAMRRQAGLPARYTRQSDPMSQRLKLGWTIARQHEYQRIIGTRGITYARYVQSERYQTAQHRATGWQTDVQIADKVVRARIPEQAVLAAVEAVLR